jgi:hypothetical protein
MIGAAFDCLLQHCLWNQFVVLFVVHVEHFLPDNCDSVTWILSYHEVNNVLLLAIGHPYLGNLYLLILM